MDLTEETPTAAMAQEATGLIEDAVEMLLRDAFSGVLWLYPAAVSCKAEGVDARAVSSSLRRRGPCAASTSAAWRGT